MQTDTIILNEIAQNERLIEHSEYGNFLISRPTHRIEADIESYRTRTMNRDLQTRDLLTDPATGEQVAVPAYLTNHAKAEQLKFHGIWTDEDAEKVNEAANDYRDYCALLDREGFEGLVEQEGKVRELRKTATELLGDKAEKYAEALDTVLLEPFGVVIEDSEAKFGTARAELMKASKTHAMSELLNKAEKLYKISVLCRRAIQAQTSLVALRMREIELFSDTIETRADHAARVAKVFYCTKNPLTKKLYWPTIAELESESSEKIGWLFEQIEKFERLEDLSEEEQSKRERFNFLRHLWAVPSDVSEDSPEVEPSKQDGDSPETSTTSTEPSATPTTS